MRLAAMVLAGAVPALLVAGCPGPDREPAHPTPASALVLPPTDGTAAALAELDRQASGGDVDAAWQRAHYLIDLFDDLRFRDGAGGRELLAAALDLKPDADTTRSVAALIDEVDRVLSLSRLHRSASAARVLLEYDRDYPDRREEVLGKMLELQAAGRVETVAGNAVLRLAGYCRRALGDATRGPMKRRAFALSHCLYPLYDADPAPYFAPPLDRPPLPRWQDLLNELDNLLERGLTEADRPRVTLQAMREELAQFRETRTDELPAPPDPRRLEPPRVDHAVPYDWTPLLPEGDDAATELVGPLEGDGRGVVALPLPAGASPERFREGVQTARAAGALAVDLLVEIAQTLEVPEGDYWAQRGSDATVRRIAALRVALGTELSGDDTPRLGPREPLWDPPRARLGLHLHVEPTRWRLLAPTGEVVSIKSDTEKGDPGTELRFALGRVQSAFDDEAGLVVVPAPETSYADIVRAIAAAARDRRGRPLFHLLALGDTLPDVESSTLARRIERRHGANVDVTPAELAPRTGAIRSCYQHLLEKNPDLTTTVTLTLTGGQLTATAAPPTPAATTCATDALRDAILDQAIPRTTVELSPTP